MKKYTPSNPVFLSEIDVVERADLVNSQVHNLTIEQLIGNDIALKTIMEKFFGSAEKPKFAEGIKASDLVGAINEVFQLGNEKKKKLVDSLVARGVPASTSDTWESLISKVSRMSDISKDTVTAAVLLSGYTAHDAAGTKITGSLADKTGTADYSAEASLDTTNKRLKLKVPSTGKYNTSNYLYAAYNTIAALIGLTAARLVKDTTVLGITGNSNNMDTSGGTAAAGDILSGKKAAVKGILVTGTMTNRGAWTGATTGTDNVAIPAGYHNGSGYVSGAGAYNKGVSDADGRSNPDSANYKAGYNSGDSAGYNRGYSEGNNTGWSNGHAAGYSEGYNAGHADASDEAHSFRFIIQQKESTHGHTSPTRYRDMKFEIYTESGETIYYDDWRERGQPSNDDNDCKYDLSFTNMVNDKTIRVKAYMRSSRLGHNPEDTDYADYRLIVFIGDAQSPGSFTKDRRMLYDSGWLGDFNRNSGPDDVVNQIITLYI